MRGDEALWPEDRGPVREIRKYDGMAAWSCTTPEGSRVALIAAADDPRLDAVADAHTRVESPHVARLVGRGTRSGEAFALFDCDAVTDGEAVVARLTAGEAKIPYPAAIAFNEFLMDAVESVHRREVGVFGAFGWRNLLIGPQGRLWLFGLGSNFPVRRKDGALASGFGVVEAPELLLGSPLSPASDVYLLHATLRAMLPYVELLPMFEEALRRADARSTQVYEALVTLSAAALAPEPGARIATVAALRTRYRAVRALVPEMPEPDDAALADRISRVVAELAPSDAVVVVDAKARTISLAGEVLDFSERAIQWRLVWRLVEAHASGAAVSIQEMSAAGWPGEKVLPEAARARVYVAISGLRKTALRGCLQKRGEGYFLSPLVRLQIDA